MNRRELGTALVIVRTDIRTSIRTVFDQPRILVAWAFVGLFVLGATGYAFLTSLAIGAALVAVDPAELTGAEELETIGLAVLAIAGAGAYMSIVAVFDDDAIESVESLLRTSVGTNVIVTGQLLGGLVRKGSILILPLLAGIVGFGIGTRSPVIGTLGAVGALVAVATGYVTGHVLSSAGIYLTNRLTVSTWLRLGLQGLLIVAVAAGIWTWIGSENALEHPLVRQSIDLGVAYASVVLAPIGVPFQLLGIGVFAGCLSVIGLGGLALVRLEAALLGLQDDDHDNDGDRSRNVPAPFARRPASRTAWYLLLRTLREPRMLSHLGLVIIYLVMFVVFQGIDSGVDPTTSAGGAVVVGTVIAGSAYCLNPLGDDWTQRPLVLTSTDRLSRLLHGRALAGLLLGGVIALGVGVPIAVLGDATLPASGLFALALLLLLSSVGTGLGFGALVPKYEASEYMNVERIHPSMVVLIVHEVGSVVVSVAGLLLLWAITDGAGTTDLTLWGIYLAVVGVFGIGGYLYARKRIERQTMEQ